MEGQDVKGWEVYKVKELLGERDWEKIRERERN